MSDDDRLGGLDGEELLSRSKELTSIEGCGWPFGFRLLISFRWFCNWMDCGEVGDADPARLGGIVDMDSPMEGI